MNTKFAHALVATGCVLLSACSSPTPELQQDEAAGTKSGLAATPAAARLASYRHTASVSRFAVGRTNEYRTEFGMQRVVGSMGVFAINEKTGMTLGIPNATAPTRARPPFSQDAARHNDEVRAYFLKAGLPPSQIARVSEQVAMQGGGRDTGEEFNPSLAQVDAYFSTVFRQAPNGVPLPDSYAWARINLDGDVVMESVYWPEIPAQVLANAETLRATLEDATKRAAFINKLPHDADSEPAAGQVAIRHTSGSWDGAFEVRASYDVRVGTRIIHYDVNGSRFDLVEEKEGAWGSPQVSAKK